MDSRKRTLNYTSHEKELLIELVAKFKTLIENKKTDASTNFKKARGWKLLANEFNSISTHCYRTDSTLKTCWENIKRNSKKKSADNKREMFKSGCCRPPSPTSGAEGVVEAILGPALEGLENAFDSDALDKLGKKECSTLHLIELLEVPNNPSDSSSASSITFDGADTSSREHLVIDISNSSGTSDKDCTNETTLKWEGWTPKYLKRPLSDTLKAKEYRCLKRRRPENNNLSDQLSQAKIKLVKTLIENAKLESQAKLLILEEQLKQEKIKTEKVQN